MIFLKIALFPLRVIAVVLTFVIFIIACVIAHAIMLLSIISYTILNAASFFCGALGLILIFCQFCTDNTMPMLHFIIVDFALFALSALIGCISFWGIELSMAIEDKAQSLLYFALGKDF